MWTYFRQALTECFECFLPPACLLCSSLLDVGQTSRSFCCECHANISALTPAHCRRCAQPFPDASTIHLCAGCLSRPPAFTKVHAAGLYQGSIKAAIHQLKYRNQLTLAYPLGRLLGTTITAAAEIFSPHRIVPVPLHLDRLRQRGYNQALEVARPLAKELGAPLDTTLLQRRLKTPQQQGLSAIARRGNLHNAFDLTSEASGLRLLLIDDVMTTGETARECCRTLLQGGAEEVQVAIVGRA